VIESSVAAAPPIRPLDAADRGEWLRLRRALWPDDTVGEHLAEMDGYFAAPRPTAVFVAPRASGGLRGLVEVAIRDYAEGCERNWIGYVEGWYVDPDSRQQGVGRALLAAAEGWAVAQGCREMASDAEVANLLSQEAHGRLGYAEVGRSVHFRKALPGSEG
jgi:aminoglycoside 6'-N-acetyltransferase I